MRSSAKLSKNNKKSKKVDSTDSYNIPYCSADYYSVLDEEAEMNLERSIREEELMLRELARINLQEVLCDSIYIEAHDDKYDLY